MMGTINCTYETPCHWCTKWDKKCDSKIQNEIRSQIDNTGYVVDNSYATTADNKMNCEDNTVLNVRTAFIPVKDKHKESR